MRKLDYFYRITISSVDETMQTLLQEVRAQIASDSLIHRICITDYPDEYTNLDSPVDRLINWLIGEFHESWQFITPLCVYLYDGDDPSAGRTEKRLRNSIDIYNYDSNHDEILGFLNVERMDYVAYLDKQFHKLGGKRVLISEL